MRDDDGHPLGDFASAVRRAGWAPAGFSVAGTFAVPTPPYADGSWELYQDFIGAVQSWGVRCW